jgi:hypothetical protein
MTNPSTAALARLTAGELRFLGEHLAGLACVKSPGVAAWAFEQCKQVSGEMARRDWVRALDRAKFDAIIAENREPPRDLTGDVEGIPPWSDVS